MKPKDVEKFFERLKAQNPEPTTELEYVNTYTLLVAVVLSAQMTDTGVNRATKALFKKVKTPQAMLDLGLEKLREHIKAVNFHNNKARNVIALSEMLVHEHGGKVPRTREELVKLPGVGRKTANVILNTAFGEPTMAVDTHIFRVSNRTSLAPGKDVDEVEQKLLDTVPAQYLQNAHHWLILHGRYTCKARKPDCPSCVVRDLCAYPAKTGE